MANKTSKNKNQTKSKRKTNRPSRLQIAVVIFSAIIVVVPMIIPVATAFHVDPVHLGIIFLTNLEIGYLMPPVGINLVIASLRFNIPIVKLYRAALPFIGILVIALLIITYLPGMSLFLVNLLGVK